MPGFGFEVVYFGAVRGGCRIEGWTAAIEDGTTWAVEYAIEVDAAWVTRRAQIRGRSADWFSAALLEADGTGHWLVDGKPGRHLDGCPGRGPGSLSDDQRAAGAADGPAGRRPGSHSAAYVRAGGLAAEPLEQTYARTTDEASCQRYDNTVPAFGFAARLIYDESGLVLDYLGIAVRAG